jgi:hypothetical protein
LIGKDIQLLHRFALDVHAPRTSQDIDESGASNLRCDDFRRQSDAGEEPGKIAAGVRMNPLLLLLNVLLRCDKGVWLNNGCRPLKLGMMGDRYSVKKRALDE